MADEKDDAKGVSRRGFLRGAGGWRGCGGRRRGHGKCHGR